MIEAAVQRCSQEKVFWKYAANLQENAHTEVQSNFIEITLRHRCSVVNLQHIFRTPFPKNTSGWLLLHDPLLSLRLLNQISMCWKWVSRKIPPENSPSWGVSGRVRARLGIKLGLGSGGFFPGGFNAAHNSKTIHVNPISR